MRIHFDGESRTELPGPFEAVNELVAGFWLWEVADMDEAIAWAKRCPNPMPGPSDLELRPFYELEDFGDAITSEQVEREEGLRSQIDEQE